MALLEKSTDQFEKIPPQNCDAEVGVLASCLLDKNALVIAIEKLKPTHFYKEAHQIIFNSFCKLFDQNQPIDLVTLTDHLQNNNQINSIGGVSFVSGLMDAIVTSAHVKNYIDIVREKAILREMIGTATNVIQKCYEDQANVDRLLDFAENNFFKISQNSLGKKEELTFRELIKDSIEKIDQLYQKKDALTGLATGFKDLDEKTSGLQKSDLIVIAARPSMGKTSLAMNIAEHVAVHQQKPVAFFSLEMSREQLVQRMLCSYARVNLHHVRKGYLSQKEWPALVDAANHLSDVELYLDDSPGLTVMELRAKARRLKSTKDIQLIVVDYMQLLEQDSRRSDSRQQEISEISRSLKALAREIDVPVVVLSQLNRSAESRSDHRPMLSDLRESGAIEQDADVVLLLMRPEYYNPEDSPGEAELNIAKQRNGPVGHMRLSFLSEYTRFENLSHYESNEI